MNNRKPSHPGAILFDEFLEPKGIQVGELAERIGIHKNTLSKIISGKSGVSIPMAMRLSRALNTTVDFWLNLQRALDKWEVENSSEFTDVISTIKPLIKK